MTIFPILSALHRQRLTSLAAVVPMLLAIGVSPGAEPAKGLAPKPMAASPAPPKVVLRKVPYLGMATSERDAEPAPGLPDGVGLVVQQVAPNAPAAKAGLQRLDVVHKLNDQVLINNPQFRVLLRTFKPGETIRLSILRQSKPMTVEVEMGSSEVPIVQSGCPGFRWVLAPARRTDTTPGSTGFSANYEDNEHVMVLRSDDAGKHLLAKDKQGLVLFEGTVNTDVEREKLPEALLPKLKQMETPPPAQAGGK